MILFGGMDEHVVDAVGLALEATAHDAQPLRADELTNGSLFARLLGARSSVVVVDAIGRCGGWLAAPIELEKVIRGAASGGARKLVLVTSREHDDPGLVALRRSGVPYHIVRVPRVVDLEAEAAAQLITTSRVVVPQALIEWTRGSVLATDIADAVVRALDTAGAGTSVEVRCAFGDGALLALLERLGAKPAVGSFRSRWWKLLGRPELCKGSSGLVAVASRTHTRDPMAEPVEAMLGGR